MNLTKADLRIIATVAQRGMWHTSKDLSLIDAAPIEVVAPLAPDAAVMDAFRALVDKHGEDAVAQRASMPRLTVADANAEVRAMIDGQET